MLLHLPVVIFSAFRIGGHAPLSLNLDVVNVVASVDLPPHFPESNDFNLYLGNAFISTDSKRHIHSTVSPKLESLLTWKTVSSHSIILIYIQIEYYNKYYFNIVCVSMCKCEWARVC